MKEYLSRYKLCCRVLCPVHIGTGEMIDPMEIARKPFTPNTPVSTACYRVRTEKVLLGFDPAKRKSMGPRYA